MREISVMHFRFVVLALLLGLLGIGVAPARADDQDTSADEQLLRSAALAADGPALLDFFRQRSAASVRADRVGGLSKQLGDKSAGVREKATAELVALGPLAVPQLREASKDVDEAEVSARAQRCLQYIDISTSANVPAAAARLVAQRRPEG